MVKKWLQNGSPVQVRRLGETSGWRVNRRHLRQRSEGAKGQVVGPAFGNSGLVMLVDLRQAFGEVVLLMVDRMIKRQFYEIQFRKNSLELRPYEFIHPVIIAHM